MRKTEQLERQTVYYGMLRVATSVSTTVLAGPAYVTRLRVLYPSRERQSRPCS